MADAPAPKEPPSLESAWKTTLRRSDPSARAWLRGAKPLALHDTHVMVAVASLFARNRIESRYRPQTEELLSDIFQRQMSLAISVEIGLELDLGEPEDTYGDEIPLSAELEDELVPPGTEATGPVELSRRAQRTTREREERFIQAQLNPKYTFENFVTAESNKFARAAAFAVAEGPGKAYNPLLIYGGSGLGKTHLLHALGHYIIQMHHGLRVRYVSTEQMTNEFINAVQEAKMPAFRRAYREVDVLLIDDIQFLEGKTQTQEEFFHTFNTLYSADKQIVMTSDRPPQALEALEQRLRSRFQSGLITDIQPPDLETRVAILRKKSIADRLSVPDPVLQFIASRVQSNIRELEGALIRVSAFASLNRCDPDVEMARTVLRDTLPTSEHAPVSVATIITQTAAYFGTSVDDVTGPSRTQTLVNARQIAMYLCREMTDLSLPRIGQEFGGKDHTTVMHAYRKIKNSLREQRTVYNQVTELTQRIHQAVTG
ncbi:MAG: chromosomal replication initiator protein DnaA [Propionibacteriaceae bacterium]|jgi:chromosomal replication initiator protein|nr:chromosomal replication initiator protein DnaA [Propionibacteriaceae bacterium]